MFAEVSSGYSDDSENAMLEALEAVGQMQAAIVSDNDVSRWLFQSVRVTEGPVFADRGLDGTVTKNKLWTATLAVAWGTEV